ncbi:MAG: FAD-binding protein [Streptosporangiales bacterium]|nr:FAD-binding protein [Streptosporangiales bacterium]
MVDFDLIVIGEGAAGLGAARAAAGRGARTLLVSEGEIGGECTFTGCVPSKTLIEAAEHGVPFEAAMRDVRAAVARVAAAEDAPALRREGIEVARGAAMFISPREIRVEGRRMRGGRYVIATGTRPALPQLPGLVDVPYLTNENVFDLAEAPGLLAVLGGGAVGCELAQAFARFGTRVTIVEARDWLLPAEDPEAGDVIQKVFAAEGVSVRTGATVERVEPCGAGVRMVVSGNAGGADSERLLVAAGRSPVTERLGLHAAGVRTDEAGFVVTDAHMATTAPGIYAAGDRCPFTHAAHAMGRIAARNALRGRGSRAARFDAAAIPRVTFTDPEVAHVGLTHPEAVDAPDAERVRLAYLPMSELDRAIAAGRTEGFVKLIAARRRLLGTVGGGRLLGATVVAHRAGEMIHEPALAIATRMFIGRLAQTTHAYPTWSVAIQQAAAQFFMSVNGRSAHPASPIYGGGFQ